MEFASPSRPRRKGMAASRLEAVERAEAYVRAHIGTPVAVRQLSHIAGLSERGLRKAFHTVRGLSPKQYMLAERLWGVHLALNDTSASRVTVSEIATAYGFYELGRFAGSYRAAFGEAPSDTLRATRRESAGQAAAKGIAHACTSQFEDDRRRGEAHDPALVAGY